ncbi:hypothetical protein D3C81_1495820 [compost metagenome]
MDARVDDLEARHHPGAGGQHVLGGDAGADQVLGEDEGDLALGARLDQAVHGEADVGAVGDLHAVGEEAEVRLVDVEHVLHGLAGDADLLADHPLALLLALLEEAQGDAVGVVQGDVRVTLGERRQGAPVAQGGE